MCGRCLREGNDHTFLSDLDAVRARKVRSVNRRKRKEKAPSGKRAVSMKVAGPVTDVKESKRRWRNYYQLPPFEQMDGVVICPFIPGHPASFMKDAHSQSVDAAQIQRQLDVDEMPQHAVSIDTDEMDVAASSLLSSAAATTIILAASSAAVLWLISWRRSIKS